MQALREAEFICLTRQEPLPSPPCFLTLRGHRGQGDDHHWPPHPTRSRDRPFPPAPIVVARLPPLPTALEQLPAQRVARAILPRAPIARRLGDPDAPHFCERTAFANGVPQDQHLVLKTIH